MSAIRLLLPVYATLFFVAAACSTSCSKNIVLIKTGSDSSAKLTALAPLHFSGVGTEIVIGGTTYNASSYVWYDFMPTVGPSTRKNPIISGFIGSTDPTKPAPFLPKTAWVIADGQVWRWEIYEVEYEADPTASYRGEAGPPLEVGSKCDVVIEFVDSSGNGYSLRTNDVDVMAVD